MTDVKRFLGVDLGAGSGRVMLGELESGKLRIEEVHRFPNDPVKLHVTLYWDIVRIVQEVKKGLAAAAQKAGGRVDGIGVDTWGVDFGLLDRAGDLLASPVHYRDSRTEGMQEEVFQKIPRETVFSETGIQFMPLNTLYQVAALKKRSPDVLSVAGKMLLIADLMHYFLTGRAVAELTLASTSQMWNPVKSQWSEVITRGLGIPPAILPEVIRPGTTIGPLREEIAREVGLKSCPMVIASACHDTAAAIAAVPATEAGPWGYLSSGTWSLLGVELPSPKITPEALKHNFTNEGGVDGTTRFLKNINGLWLIQECRKRWAKEGQDLGYGELTSMAEKSRSRGSFIVPDDPTFFAPEDMPKAIVDFCRRTGQKVPETKGEIVLCALESLALTYRAVAQLASDVSGQKIERLHIVGGGTRNRLLNQLAANALQLPVLAGPVEATAMGNILVQGTATGDVASIQELRRIVRNSENMEEYLPRDPAQWEEKYAAFQRLKA